MLWRYVRTEYVVRTEFVQYEQIVLSTNRLCMYEQIVYVRTDCVCTDRLCFNHTHGV